MKTLKIFIYINLLCRSIVSLTFQPIGDGVSFKGFTKPMVDSFQLVYKSPYSVFPIFQICETKETIKTLNTWTGKHKTRFRIALNAPNSGRSLKIRNVEQGWYMGIDV